MDNSSRKGSFSYLLLLCQSPLLSGCWDRVEVNDLAIVTAAVIDKKDDNQIELSNQILVTLNGKYILSLSLFQTRDAKKQTINRL